MKQHARTFLNEVGIVSLGLIVGAQLAAPLWNGGDVTASLVPTMVVPTVQNVALIAPEAITAAEVETDESAIADIMKELEELMRLLDSYEMGRESMIVSEEEVVIDTTKEARTATAKAVNSRGCEWHGFVCR